MQRTLFYGVALAAFLGGCAVVGGIRFSEQYGPAEPRERLVASVDPDDVDYWSDVKPVLEKRCVACHGCYDAPCQLKLSSIEGVERGASKTQTYDMERLLAAEPRRLFVDAHSVAEWREKDFFPVLNEYPDSAEANREASVMYRALRLKMAHPLPSISPLPDRFDVSLDRAEQCPTAETYDHFEKKFPDWGMPYALPGLAPDESQVLMRWIEQGSRYTARPPLDSESEQQRKIWEEFLNGDSLKQQLMSRYIYEHLFVGHLYFEGIGDRIFFRLVRSATPPGEPIEVVASRRPTDDPGVERVYYRLDRERGSIIAKTHMPYALNPARMTRWRALFLEAEYEVAELPSYEPEVSTNPFRSFRDLPVRSRYRFMLDESQFTIMGFIKGPVCRGQVALNVINDHFWVFFVDPDQFRPGESADFLAAEAGNLRFPASDESTVLRPISYFLKLSSLQKKFLDAKGERIRKLFGGKTPIGLDLIWDGGGTNPNAGVTIFRNFNSATVEQGLLGGPPKTAWVMGYTLLERIHYLLVAGYDVYGNAGHQLVTRGYMDFLRMEGEANFLMFLPASARSGVRDFWYRGADERVRNHLEFARIENDLEPDIDYQGDDFQSELYGLLSNRLAAALPDRHLLGSLEDGAVRMELERLDQLVGGGVTQLPQVAFLQIRGGDSRQYASLIRNNAHLNITSLFDENANRIPEEDVLSVMPGFVGAYPNALYVVDQSALSDFVDAVIALRTEADYRRLLDRYAVRRSSADFWQHSDVIHAAARRLEPISHGIFDYNRLENR
jgi:hypothetical protein